MTQASGATNVTESIERWQSKTGNIQHISTLMNLSGNILMLVASVAVLYVVKVKRRR